VTLVLLHAFPLDERMWEPQRGFGATAPSLYGRGRTMDAIAGSILAETGGELVLVGASMGGYCALAAARNAPDRVRAVLLAGSRPGADTPERRAGRSDTIRLIREAGPEALWEDLRPKLFADPEALDASLLHREADDLVDAVSAIRDRDDLTEVARGLGERLLFVVGERDSFVSAGDLREFEVRELEACAHLPSLERPEEFNAILTEFLARV
jgi:3-oxoadipate enol-lactonase